MLSKPKPGHLVLTVHIHERKRQTGDRERKNEDADRTHQIMNKDGGVQRSLPL